MKLVGIVAVVAVILSALTVWYMAVLPLRREYEASEELLDELRGKLEVSQVEASGLKEENFILTQTVSALESSRRSLEQKEAAELRYWQEKYTEVVEELRHDVKSQTELFDRTEANFLEAMSGLVNCESAVSECNARIADLASSMSDMEDDCTLALEYASAETRDCFELLSDARELAKDREALLSQVDTLEYEVASLGRALDRQMYTIQARESLEEEKPLKEEIEAEHRAAEEPFIYENDSYETESELLQELWNDKDEEEIWEPLVQFNDDDDDWQERKDERLWKDGPGEIDVDGGDWYSESTEPVDKIELALEAYKDRYDAARKRREEALFRDALEADDNDDENSASDPYYDYLDEYYNEYSDSYGEDSSRDDYPGLDYDRGVQGPPGKAVVAWYEERLERAEEWWDELEMDSELVYDDDLDLQAFDDEGDEFFFGGDDGDMLADDAAEEYADDSDAIGFFEAKELDGLRNEADRELDARELKRAEEAERDWDLGPLDDFDAAFSYNAEVFQDDDEGDYYIDDDEELPAFDGFDDDGYGDEELLGFLAQGNFDDDDEGYDY